MRLWFIYIRTHIALAFASAMIRPIGPYHQLLLLILITFNIEPINKVAVIVLPIAAEAVGQV